MSQLVFSKTDKMHNIKCTDLIIFKCMAGAQHGYLLLNRYRVSVWENEEVFEMDGGDG